MKGEEIEQQSETDEKVSEEQDANISDEVTTSDVAQRFKSRYDKMGWRSEPHDVHGSCCDESLS